ncbi:CDP-glycerol glycerophosphotransferase family protein [Terrisporobacter petrolearius]|uniref:CDP-glycerol glycerophosphotransferase family protein n=1 Tax=Terrisporobacter petrolearius TaxID=1460447 RepID=UPI001D1608B6|nr:CDP-glycerol glycerophosphotransferase family protein [Terrisporobacter petrolearius]MCC3862835.1 CDP-glycerol glycerophosphotransferase family protein [Terrisporobacter petrolearius]
MLKEIHTYLKKNNIEDAFNLMSKCENEYKNNSTYWTLRAELCILISEYDIALLCCEKAINLNSKNTYAISSAITLSNYLQNQDLYDKYCEMLCEVKESLSAMMINNILNDLDLLQSRENINYIQDVLSNKKENLCYIVDDMVMSNNECIHLLYFKECSLANEDGSIIVPLNKNYIKAINTLIEYDISSFSVLIKYSGELHLIKIEEKTFDEIKNVDRESTIVFHYLNESDSNVYALYKNIPEKIKGKFNTLLLRGSDDLNIKNMAIVPLMAKYSVSGHGLFLSYPCPELMHNIEVGHGAVPFKSCGVMDNMPGFAFMPEQYKNVDTYCVSSQLDMTLFASFTHVAKDKFFISGIPRTDFLLNSKGRKNLEKILNIKLDNKKVIFNMPTFTVHENSGRVDGDKDLNSFIKIKEFDYDKFDEFLGENNYICILKVHHGEEKTLCKNRSNRFKNIYTVSNEDLGKFNLDLYEILNAGDLLLTDYSSIYGDFLFMNKPTVFINTDIDEFSKNRGLALEPYDFWTAGPKVQYQEELLKEIKTSLDDKNYYLERRCELRKVYHKYLDGKASERIWNYLDTKFYSKYLKAKIQTLIENNCIPEAKKLLDMYIYYYKYDVSIYSMAGIISLNDNLNQALKNFQRGLELDSSNVDLLYNMGYLYTLLGDKKQAIDYYENCILTTDDENLKNEIYKVVNSMRKELNPNTSTIIMLDEDKTILKELSNLGNSVVTVVENDDITSENIYEKDGIKIYEVNPIRIKQTLNYLTKTNENPIVLYSDIRKSSIVHNVKDEAKILYFPSKNYYVDKSNYSNHGIDMFVEKEACNNADLIIARDINIYNSKKIIEERENVYLTDGRIGEIGALDYILKNYEKIDFESINYNIKYCLENIEDEYIRSLYLIASESGNIQNCIKIIKNIYKKYNTEEIYQLYITLLSRIKDYMNLISVAIQSDYYEDVYKCELLYLNSIEEYELIEFVINMVIKNYKFVEQMSNDNADYKLAFYNFELNRYVVAFDKYIKMLKENTKLSKSALVNRNISYLMYASNNKDYKKYYSAYEESMKCLEEDTTFDLNNSDIFDNIFECLKDYITKDKNI